MAREHRQCAHATYRIDSTAADGCTNLDDTANR